VSQPPPNNALKLPVSILGVAGCAVLIAYGAAEGKWITFALGVVLLAIGCAQIRAILQGRNPWWSRAPLDYQRDPNKRNRWRHEG